MKLGKNHLTIISLIKNCKTLKQITKIYTQLLINGHLNNNPHLHGQFVASISLKHHEYLDYASQVLSRYENPSLFAFNSMIRAHSKGPNPQKSFCFYQQILNNHRPDNYTFAFLVRACAQIGAHKAGPATHSAVLRYGFGNDSHVRCGLVYMYSELGQLGSARNVFDEIPDPDLVTRTAMLTACARLGDINFAERLFDEMTGKDLVAWTSMISGYAQCGKSREALDLFHSMQVKGVRINEVAMISVLCACSSLGALDQGKWAHAYIHKNKIPLTLVLGTALIDMYAKCGNINDAMDVFWGMRERNVYTYSSAMNGLAMNGYGEICLELFSLMKQEGIRPNEITFISVLRACSVIGLVDEGIEHFKSMKTEFGIEPVIDHYGCIVDLYARCGRINEAFEFIREMPIKPHAFTWGSLLHACGKYKNTELGEIASRKLVELDTNNHGAFVLLSNIYADSRDWDKVRELRGEMKGKGVNKIPGCSTIEIDGVVHEFFAGDKSHVRYYEIEAKLGEVYFGIRFCGY